MNTQKLPEVELAPRIERQLEEAEQEAYVREGLEYLSKKYLLDINVEADAAQHGISVDEYIHRAIKPAPARPMTGAEAIEYWDREGLGGVYADREESSQLARTLRRQEEARGRDAA